MPPPLLMTAKIILMPFLAGILTSKTVRQSAPEYAVFIQKIEKFPGEGAPLYLQTPSPAEAGRDTPTSTHPARRLDPSALDPWPSSPRMPPIPYKTLQIHHR